MLIRVFREICDTLHAFLCVFYVLCCLLSLYRWFALSKRTYLKENLDIRVKYPTCLLSLGLATGAASSACRFLQEDRAPLTAWLLMISFLTMINTHKHTNWHKLRNLRIKCCVFFSKKKKVFTVLFPIYLSRSYFVKAHKLPFLICYRSFLFMLFKMRICSTGKETIFLKWY